MAAAALLDQGCRVHLVHVGYDDDVYRARIPDEPFAKIRETDANQAHYFLGADMEGVPSGSVRIGSQLTPPRQFTVRNADKYLPVESNSFEPMQSLAVGGLGAAWGAAAYTYSNAELQRMGIGETGFSDQYQQVADIIGISAARDDDTSPDCIGQLARTQPPLEIDSNAEALLDKYARGKRSSRFKLGRIPLAILSQDLGARQANPYFDMDFWSDSRQSIYRPRYTLADLQQRPGFRCTSGTLATAFTESIDGVTLHGIRPDEGGQSVTHQAKRLILAAGALNSARIVLASRRQAGVHAPVLCNPYTYMPCILASRLGRGSRPARHSMAQLAGLFAPAEAPDDLVSLQFYSYRSLLAFKLVKEIPLHPWAGLQCVRLLIDSLVIVGVHHPDSPNPLNWLSVRDAGSGGAWPLVLQYAPSTQLQQARASRERAILLELAKLGCLGGARLRPGHASSIHYAGTIPHLEPGSEDRHGLDPQGRLLGTSSVYVADNAGWNFLPAKGLTLTIMANARRIAAHAAHSLGHAQ